MNDTETKMPSMFLFSRPSFFEGMGRLFDFGGTSTDYNTSLNGVQADRLAFKADLAALKNDIAIAREQLEAELVDKF